MSVYRAAISSVFVLAFVLAAGRTAVAQAPPDGKDLESYFAPLPKPPLTDPKQIEIWRKQFPYQSLAERLTYEKSLGAIASPRLTEPGKHILQEIDAPKDRDRGFSQAYGESRALSLRLLHSGKIDEFTQQDQFGARRLPLPGPDYMVVHEPDPVPFDQPPPLSAEFDIGQAVSQAPESETETTGNPWRLPTRAKLVDFNLDSQFGFVAPHTLGDVHDVDRVAGFMSHGFRHGLFPPVNEALKRPESEIGFYAPRYRWRVVRLELVSLLKHPTPMAYVSDHLPRMDELAAAKTRPLTGFEAESLAKLQAGEDVVEHSTANLIDMVGCVRAAKKCISCHSVPYGTLLGAFSYQLQRDPPIKSPPAN